ncbi:Helix-turn-helix [Microbacterium saccharophilum]|uniref:Helix-turn-helix n=1 Tax=Microbacterium saccharophilum TaxID=1213358 RepID=A0A7Z7CWU7_9MICO|nr:Helix-turn-helix [Microbacterium saccharophilum]
MIPATTDPRSGRIAVWTAVVGTVFIAVGAFWLSFTALADLAHASGIAATQAWAWPLIVDGIIVVGTVAVVALAGQRGAWYPWMLLMIGAAVSVTANSIHAVVAADANVLPVLAASVAAVPPLVLLAITHLTVVLTQRFRLHVSSTAETPRDLSTEVVPIRSLVEVPEKGARRSVAALMRQRGMSNKEIASATGVHPSTVGRWFAGTIGTPEVQKEVTS